MHFGGNITLRRYGSSQCHGCGHNLQVGRQVQTAEHKVLVGGDIVEEGKEMQHTEHEGDKQNNEVANDLHRAKDDGGGRNVEE